MIEEVSVKQTAWRLSLIEGNNSFNLHLSFYNDILLFSFIYIHLTTWYITKHLKCNLVYFSQPYGQFTSFNVNKYRLTDTKDLYIVCTNICIIYMRLIYSCFIFHFDCAHVRIINIEMLEKFFVYQVTFIHRFSVIKISMFPSIYVKIKLFIYNVIRKIKKISIILTSIIHDTV